MSEIAKRKRKKKFNSKFYNIDYCKYVAVKKLEDNVLIPCKVMNQITYAMIKYMEEKFGFCADAYERKKLENDSSKTLIYINGMIAKGKLTAAKQYACEHNCIIQHDRMIIHHIKNTEGYLFAGWNTGIRTKIKPEDLPISYVYTSNYKKHGYLETADVTDVLYKPSSFDNHAFKDDFLYISYKEPLYYDDKRPFDIYTSADEYIFGNDIIDIVNGIEKNNQDNAELLEKIEKIKHQMVRKYNAFADNYGYEHISEEELFS